MSNVYRFPKHVEPESTNFSVFTGPDIKKLSVQKIITPLIFDAMGHPVPGGLYDKFLGPTTDRSELCGTCNENIYTCPGHFSHIELPVPVVNPLFHKVTGTILKCSCLTCFRIQIDEKTRLNLRFDRDTDVMKAISDEVKTGKSCVFCKNLIKRIQVLKNRIIVIGRKSDNPLKPVESQYVNPAQSKNYLRKIWENEEEFLRLIAPVLNKIELDYPTDVFFMDTVLVPPPNVRPVNVIRDRALENPQSAGYKNIITNALVLSQLITLVQKKGDVDSLTTKEEKEFYLTAKGNTSIEKLNNCWEDLQNDINGLFNKETRVAQEGIGLKQIIEKKVGIIRQNMMGKRVNFAARSVITPDPNLDIGEVGIPEVFAKKLIYPVPVTPWNVEYLRKLISNGPDTYPGAVAIEMEDGRLKRIDPSNKTQQESLLKILLTPHDKKKRGFQGIKRVHRHLQNGDVLLLNRQPTLHKPSIMAHRARILKGEKTLRMHYANCKAYNADFDGDEMNAHFPQDEVARSEGYNIVEVARQYLVPKDGTPLSGLIQDHMIAGVRLSLRGKFFDRMDYEQLVFQALSHKIDKIKTLTPAIIKPTPMWSGKQIFSTIMINVIPSDRELINLKGSTKIPPKAWQTSEPRPWACGAVFTDDKNMSEAEVIIRQGELLCGILDKTHYGATAYGLVHCMYELYGGTCALQFLSSLTKLFTSFLQQDGFTLGVHDILTTKYADKSRKKTMKKLRRIGKKVMTEVLSLPDDADVAEIAATKDKLIADDPKFLQVIDRQYKTALDSYTNKINKSCLPMGLISKFPQNNLQLMVQSGAKGSTVNTMQISCLLGQIELEGKRPPLMISGKSLPSFPTVEFSPRSGGFIDGRFMTGIQPQEFFFHCMAGREGLIDTAVKTSRSGYLQRCLIKHLEGVHVAYDLTVRNSDSKVIQFMYGEDGMDISKVQFLNDKQLSFLQDNAKSVVLKDVLKQLKGDDRQDLVESYNQLVDVWVQENGDPFDRKHASPFSMYTSQTGSKESLKLWTELDPESKRAFTEACSRCPDPITSLYQPDHHFGSLNERLQSMKRRFLQGKRKKIRREVDDMLKFKAMRSLCAPGEPVGLLAAQSIGEPSTQMTLNTFHFAGRGEMNVTLGIPRLREILMMASKNIKTPSMEIPFLQVADLDSKAQNLKRNLNRVSIENILENVEVGVKLQLQPRRIYKYTLRFQFLPEDHCKDYHASISSVFRHMKKRFFKEMFIAIDKLSKVRSRLVVMEEQKLKARAARDEGDSEEDTRTQPKDQNANDSSDDEVEDQEDAKMTNKHVESREDQEAEDEEEKLDANVDDEETEDVHANQEENDVLDSYLFADSYNQDKKRRRCELTFSLPMTYKRIDMTAILKDAASKSVLWQTPNIRRAITYEKDGVLTLRTDGINIIEMFKYHDLLDLNRLYCNDIHKMADTYGIEAALKIIVKEVKDVFNVYGIKVDPRHLSLIADYMTSTGLYTPMNRKGIESSTSPFQQMSFESPSAFLKDATLKARQDDLNNPSSRLMFGMPCKVGTEIFHLVQTLA